MASRPPTLEFLDATQVRVGGRDWLYFAGCNYLGLSGHPRVRAAVARSARGWLQPGASRTTTGEQPAYRGLERRLAGHFRVPAAALCPSGYLATITAFQALRDEVSPVLLDDRAHACGADGARLSARRIIRFRHGDAEDLRRKLQNLPRTARPLVACDGVRAADGGVTPVDAYLAVLPRAGWLLVDDAHGAGAVGPAGRGTMALLGLRDARIIQTISLAKAFGVAGGAVLGPRAFIARLRHSAAGYVGSTAPWLPVVAAVGAALEVMGRSPALTRRLQGNAALLHSLLPEQPEVVSDPRTPVKAVIPRTALGVRSLRRTLRAAGIFPPFIRYAGGPAEGFFRFALTAAHTEEEIRRLAAAIRAGL